MLGARPGAVCNVSHLGGTMTIGLDDLSVDIPERWRPLDGGEAVLAGVLFIGALVLRRWTPVSGALGVLFATRWSPQQSFRVSWPCRCSSS